MVSGMLTLTRTVPGPLARNFTPTKFEALYGQRTPLFTQLSDVAQETPHCFCPAAFKCAAKRLSLLASLGASCWAANAPLGGSTADPSVLSVAVYHQPSRWKALNGLASPSSKSSISAISPAGEFAAHGPCAAGAS